MAAIRLAGTVDALFVNNDNTALAAFEAVVQAGLRHSIPVFVSDTDMLDRGALAALGPNQYEIGKQAGNQVARLLMGEKISSITVEFPQKIELHLNEDIAKSLNIKIPERIKKRAKRVVKTDKKY
ncbi:MAG: ABC transporter substrate binding protein [Pseudomonadota bacterium]